MYTNSLVYEYISKATNDPIVEWRICTISWSKFPIYQSDVSFYNNISSILPSSFSFPFPTLCPEERQRRRLSFRNEKCLYKRPCYHCGNQFISVYSPDCQIKALCTDCWQNSDITNAMFEKANSLEFDMSKSFFENIKGLFYARPVRGMANSGDAKEHNYEYTNYCYNSKNAYLCYNSAHMQDCMYMYGCSRVNNAVDCLDCRWSDQAYIEHAYECYKCNYCYFIFYCSNLAHCNYCYYCTNCQNCSYALWCVNLMGQKDCYTILNRKVSKEKFEQTLDAIRNDDDARKQFLSDYQDLLNKKIIQATNNQKSEFCIGNEIHNCKNCVLCFDIPWWSHDNKYCMHRSNGTADARDCNVTGASERILESLDMMRNYDSFFCIRCWDSDTVLYCIDCRNCKNCFACIGLDHKSYCIFNKQYTQDEYEKIIRKLIEHMQDTGERGEFFHPSLSPFWYNETVAQEYYPLTSVTCNLLPVTSPSNEQETGNRQQMTGYKRSTYSADPKIPDWAKTIKPQEYTQEEWKALRDTPDITKQIIICEVSHRPFLLQKAEIEFYQKHNLPIPTKHPDIRHEERMKLRPWRTLHLRNCDKCGKEMLSVYNAEDRQQGRDSSTSAILLIPSLRSGWQSEKVYCETCYKQEVYG